MPINSFENYPMSWKPKLQKNGIPLYIQLSGQLQEDIACGRLLPGTKLPPQRELADYLDINVSTVSRAFRLCAQKGLLSGSVGSGTYISYNIPTNIFDTPNDTDASVIELASMTPELIPQEEIRELLAKMMAEPDFGECFQYTHGTAPRHRNAALQLLKRAGCPAAPGQIQVSSGGQNAIAAIFAGLLSPGDRVGVDPLVYPGLKSAAQLFGIQLIPIAQKNGEMSEEGLNYAIANEAIKAIYIMPEAQNPTTHTMSVRCRQMIARTAKAHELLVIEDGINCLLSQTVAPSVCSFAPENVLFVLSLSKTITPALRLAYLAVPARYQSRMETALYNINLSQSALLQELAARLILSGKLDTLLARRREGIRKRNRLADEMLKGYTVYGTPDSLNRWLLLPGSVTGMEFERMALERNVHVYGSERFAVGSAPPIGAARLAVCAPRTIKELEKGLSVLQALLCELS